MEKEIEENISSQKAIFSNIVFNMVFPQVIAAFHTIFNIIGLPGNLLVIVTIALERRFRVMRYILLASLAVSDILFLILVNSFRIASIAQERWLYGQTMCYLSASFMRYFYLNTVLHLIAVSYERYKAIVKSPMTYDGTITKSRVMFIALIWIIPIPFSIGPFLVWGKYVYNPEVFYCDQGWAVKGDVSAMSVLFYVLFSFVAPFLVIVFLNWRVFKTARTLQRNVVAVQLESLADVPESQLQVISRRMRERKAAVDVSIIIAAFLLCYLPAWISGICRQFVESITVTAEVILATACIFIFSSLCNPIIYSIRKKEFRTGVKNVLKRMGACRCSNDINDNVRNTRDARPAYQSRSEAFYLRRSITREALAAENHNRGLFGSTENVAGLSFRKNCVSPIKEITE